MFKQKVHAWLLRRWYSHSPIGMLIPLSGLYMLLTALRRWAYRCGILHSVFLPAPVIVVGNITVGGTGKTPFVIWLAHSLREQGYSPGIVTRGYRGQSQHWPILVTPDSDPRLAGDEAVLLARRTRLPVMADPDRLRAAQRLLDEHAVNVIVSDDGLQHYRLGRAVEIIMLDGERGLGNCWRLPAGPLREPAARLKQADFVICKMGSAAPTNVPAGALVMHLMPETVMRLSREEPFTLTQFAGQQVHAVAGIGNPQQFFAMLSDHGLRVEGRALPDHAVVSEADLSFGDDRPVFMTEKDAIKCRGFKLSNHWYVTVSARFSEDNARRILGFIRGRLMAAGAKPERAEDARRQEKIDGR